MRIPDPKANTTTEAYLAYKAGYLEESELKSKLYKPDWHFDGWLAYWAGLTNTYPLDENGDPEMLCDEEVLVAYLSGVTDTYPEEIKNPYDVRIVGYLKHLAAKRWPEPDYPVNNEEFYLSTMEPTHTSNPTPSADIELDTSEGKIISVEAYGDTFQQTYSGKNLLNVSLLPITSYGITISKDDSGNIVLNGTPDYNSGYKGFTIGNTQTVGAGTYTLSVENKKEGIGLSIGGFKGQMNLTMSDTAKTKTGTTNESVSLQPTLNIRYDVGTLNNFIFNPQLEQSSTATSYEPYTGGIPSPNPDYPQEIRNVTGNVEVTISNNDNSESQTLPVSLGDIELCKIGNYQDYFYKASDKWYLHKEIKKILLNGTEGWSVSNNVFYLTSISDYINSSGKICLSDKYTAINNTSVGTSAITQNNSICFFSTNTNPRLYIRDERFNNVNAFKAELSENNVKVYYPTVTPTDTEITDSTLIAQLNALAGADTYDEKTYIKVTANDPNLPALLKVEAYKY